MAKKKSILILDADCLKKGSLHALAHAAHLVEDAAILFAAGRVSSGFVLAVMSREELGRCNFLWRTGISADNGESISAETVEGGMENHIDKLKLGISTFEVRLPSDMIKRWTVAIESNDKAELELIHKERRQIVANVKVHAPGNLHKRRLAAQYVDLNLDNGSWLLPANIRASETHSLIFTVLSEIESVLIGAAEYAPIFGVHLPLFHTLSQRVLPHLLQGQQ